MFGRPPSGGLLSSWGRGVDGSRGAPRFDAEPNMLAVRSRYVGCVGRIWWARLLRLSAALFRSAEPHCKPRLKPMPRTSPQVSPQAYARPLLDPTLKCSLTYTAPAYRSLPRMLPILRACDTLRSKMRGVLPEIRWFSSNECAPGCTLGGSAGVGNGKPQVNVLCLLP